MKQNCNKTWARLGIAEATTSIPQSLLLTHMSDLCRREKDFQRKWRWVLGHFLIKGFSLFHLAIADIAMNMILNAILNG